MLQLPGRIRLDQGAGTRVIVIGRTAYLVDTVPDQVPSDLAPNMLMKSMNIVVLSKCHLPDFCADESRCVLHNPSNHPMRKLAIAWNFETKVISRVCLHGILHPDPDAVWFDPTKSNHWPCCGCCNGSYEDAWALMF